MAPSERRVHVVLGSGGARVISYIGALDELTRAGYSVASFSTSSAGTLVGALVAGGLAPADLAEKVLVTRLEAFAGERRWLPPFLAWPYAKYSRSLLPRILREFLGKDDLTFSELAMPFATIALDVISRRLLVYSEATHPDMPVSEALEIATAVPGLYPPHERHGRILIDGGVASALPIWLATRHGDRLPIIVLSTSGNLEATRPRSFADYLGRVIESSIAGRDDILIEQIRRAVRVDVFCGDVPHDRFQLSSEQKRFLIESGRRAMATAISQDLSRGLDASPTSRGRAGDDRAESYATQITNYFFQGEVHMGHVINTGDRSIVNVESSLRNTQQVIGDSNHFTEAEKAQLDGLVSALRAEIASLAEAHAAEASLIAQRLDELLGLANHPKEQRKRSLLDISAKGLKEAAGALADIAPTVLDIAAKVAGFVLGLA